MVFTTKKCSNQNLVCPGYSTTQKLRAPTLQGGSGKSVLKPAPELQALHGSRLLLVEIVLCLLLIMSPETTGAAIPVMVLILVFSTVIYGVRGVYYSTMSETGVPVTLTATATAAVAVFGYTPDMFMSLWCGRILDTHGYQEGYKQIFVLMLIFACLAVGVCLMMLWYQRKVVKNRQ